MTGVQKAVKSFGLPRIVIIAFFLLLLVMAAASGMDMLALMGDVLRRWGMYGILVLAMVPSIQCGVGPNFGVTIGIVGGLASALITIDMRFYGMFDGLSGNPATSAMLQAFLTILLTVVISGIFGVVYGVLLNRVKGSEMTVTTYIGFSIVALFNILWLTLPFRSPTSIWPLAGEGLRNTISLQDDFSNVFNNFLRLNIGGMEVPTGMLLLFFAACFFIWLFTKSRTGMMMSAAGANPKFAQAAGINVDGMRILGITISTALGGVGIVVYAQSFGFLQLYNAPQMMGIACVASVLVGGASIKSARIVHVLLGAFLFHGMLAIAQPVANNIIPEGNLSEILRMIISNGIILYALSQSREVAK